MAKLISSLFLPSIVTGGRSLYNFYSSANTLATHIEALSKNSTSVRRNPKKYDPFDNVDDALALFHKMIDKYPKPSIVEFNKLLAPISILI
ncbi:pentatricopeptide repeat 3 [Hibiscus trionum]|uniref:Pentatricopeptide repeat 3 n=1 Tax=Hibiscus trionum TaxID=183268 RepID=A0A9W7GXB6_HIBTR|nr:pentatricopeptide repeat 3 [Hibiscus trionum]